MLSWQVENRHRPKGVFGKGVGKSKNASEMRQTCVKMGLVLVGKEERSKMRQKCVKIVSKMRGTPLGENTFWTIPRKVFPQISPDFSHQRFKHVQSKFITIFTAEHTSAGMAALENCTPQNLGRHVCRTKLPPKNF